MPKNYYCDFCHCTFPDSKVNRTNHIQGRTHVNNRRLHYDWFNVYRSAGIHPRTIEQASLQILFKPWLFHIQIDPYTGQYKFPKEILYFQSLASQPTIVKNKRYKLPPGWKLKDLPPSLKPPIKDQNYHWDHTAQWG
ncbi:uncharacterized protein RHIMIDRAFT_300032 [Rhizopus microsporus ATCC 52813]|uniref:U1-C C2H2-type zinc finger domain-containing protein n=1 Tax=Rhizopus microsporus ATCC 52813 TaxID=1340429 RepID=A0A2G4SKF5_RHIZD|nr:uncharacterized protein RHIMIDRAFT_300032 [Rhizopus microsporus ATCC 52813]PHZ09243.1 hypothetical protein RHIMIDRAFT_300032 [Rhizopus microsporus ATCC 52813]